MWGQFIILLISIHVRTIGNDRQFKIVKDN